MADFDESLLVPVEDKAATQKQQFDESLLVPVEKTPAQRAAKGAKLRAELETVRGQDRFARWFGEDVPLLPYVPPGPQAAAEFASPVGFPMRPLAVPPDSIAARVAQTGQAATEAMTRPISEMTRPSMLPLAPLAFIPGPTGHLARKAMVLYFGGQAIGEGAGELSVGLKTGDPQQIGGGAGSMLLGGTMVHLPESVRELMQEQKPTPTPGAEVPVPEGLKPQMGGATEQVVRAGTGPHERAVVAQGAAQKAISDVSARLETVRQQLAQAAAQPEAAAASTMARGAGAPGEAAESIVRLADEALERARAISKEAEASPADPQVLESLEGVTKELLEIATKLPVIARTGGQDAIEDKTSGAVHEPVPAQPGEGEQTVPAKTGGAGVPTSEETTGEVPLKERTGGTPVPLSPTVEGLRRELEQLAGGEVTDASLARSAQITRELEALEGKSDPEGGKAPQMTEQGGEVPLGTKGTETTSLTGPTSPTMGEGPGAAPRGFGPYPAVQQLTDQLNAEAPVGAKERLAWGDRKADLWAAGKDVLARTLARARNVSQTAKGIARGVSAPNDLDRRIGEYDWAIQQSSAMSRAAKKAMERQMPDVTDRNAAAVLIDSARIAADPNNPAEVRQVIKDALALFPKETPPFVRRAFERALDPSLELRQFSESLKQYFGVREQDAVGADLFEQGLQDYYTHVWKKPENMPGSLRGLMANGRVSTYFQFGRQRKLSSFVEGILEGKTPVLDPAEVLPFYNFSMDRAIASRELIRRLGDLKASDGRPAVAALGAGKVVEPVTADSPVLINPRVQSDKVNDYETVDHPALRRWKWLAKTPDGRDVMLNADLVVHREFAERLRRFMDKARLTPGPKMRVALAVSSGVKQLKLAAVPSLFHQVHLGSHALFHWTQPFKVRPIDWESPKTRFAVEQGHLKLASDERELSILAEGLAAGDWIKALSKSGIPGVSQLTKWSHVYSAWLFNDYVPRLKLATFENAMEGYRHGLVRGKLLKMGRDLRSGRLSEEEAASRIGDAVNNAYGELNHLFLNKLGRDPRVQRGLRLAFLAPDFGEARARFAGKALTQYGSEERLAMMTLMATFWVGARVANFLSHGDTENDLKHAFQVKVGDKWFSMRSVAGDISHAISDPGQFTFVRLNPALVRPGADFLYSRDQGSGRKLDAQEKLTRMAQTLLPIQLGNLTRDDQEWWESFSTSMGVSMKHEVASIEMSKLAQQWLKDQGRRNAPAEFIATQEPGYQKLRLALRMGKDSLASGVLEHLRRTRTDKMIENAMSAHVDRPFTGTWELEGVFQGTLNAKQRTLYLAARQQELDELQAFYRLLAYHPR